MTDRHTDRLCHSICRSSLRCAVENHSRSFLLNNVSYCEICVRSSTSVKTSNKLINLTVNILKGFTDVLVRGRFSRVAYLPSVLWHCWLGHLTRKNPSPYDLCVGGTLSLTQSIKPAWRFASFIGYFTALKQKYYFLYQQGQQDLWSLTFHFTVSC